jgi:hypothetical protein
MDKFTKQPADRLDYDVVASDWLADGDTVSSVPTYDVAALTGEVTPSLAVDSIDLEAAGQRVKLWISGGTAGHDYKVTLLLQTAGGRAKEHEFVMKVRDK